MRAITFCGLLLAAAVAFAMPTHAYVGVGYKVPACTGSAATDTATLQTAFAKGGVLILPVCEYVVSSTLRLKNGTHLIGAGVDATTNRSVITDGRPLIDSNASTYLSGVRLSDMSFVGPFGQGQSGLGDAFLLYAATNISVFHNLRIANFRGNAFTIKTQTGSPGDPTTLLNADFNSIVIENVGGYAFDLAKRVHATWENIVIDSPVMGGFRFRKGNANQSFINIRGLVAKWHQPWSSANHVVVLDIADYQTITFEGCQFSVSTAANPSNLTFIRTNSTFYPNLMACTATGTPFKYWVANTKYPGQNKPYAAAITFRF
jgi:hypothetical protein